jgi:hypothetical protein
MFLLGWGYQAALLWTHSLKPVHIVVLMGLLASCSRPKPQETVFPPRESLSELKQTIALIRRLPFSIKFRCPTNRRTQLMRLRKKFFPSTGLSPSFIFHVPTSGSGCFRSPPTLPQPSLTT